MFQILYPISIPSCCVFQVTLYMCIPIPFIHRYFMSLYMCPHSMSLCYAPIPHHCVCTPYHVTICVPIPCHCVMPPFHITVYVPHTMSMCMCPHSMSLHVCTCPFNFYIPIPFHSKPRMRPDPFNTRLWPTGQPAVYTHQWNNYRNTVAECGQHTDTEFKWRMYGDSRSQRWPAYLLQSFLSQQNGKVVPLLTSMIWNFLPPSPSLSPSLPPSLPPSFPPFPPSPLLSSPVTRSYGSNGLQSHEVTVTADGGPEYREIIRMPAGRKSLDTRSYLT